MMLSLIFPIAVLGKSFDGYGPTRFDDTLSPETPGKDLAGYGLDHFRKRENKGFGDLSLVDFNMEVDKGFNRDLLVDVAWEVLDSSHPSVMAIQLVRKDEIDALTTRGLGHYGIVNVSEGSIDVLSDPTTYLPIFFDTIALKVKKSGYHRDPKNDKIIYGSWAIFEHRDERRLFTVVNLDMYSAYSAKTDAQMANILQDLRKDYTVGTNPVFFMGGINAISDKLQKVIDDKYINPLDTDLNAKDGLRFTMKNPSDVASNHERDFVLIRNTASSVVKVNYARILRKDIPTFHYPLHIIVSFEGGEDRGRMHLQSRE